VSDVLKDYDLLILQSEVWTGPPDPQYAGEEVPEEFRPTAEHFCIRDLAAALRAEREPVAELEADARLGRMVRAAREAVLDYDMPFHQCTCCGGCHVYDVELCRFVARHTPDCAWAALVKVIKSEPEGGKHEGFDIGRDRAIGK
jgi:hypothetical protein